MSDLWMLALQGVRKADRKQGLLGLQEAFERMRLQARREEIGSEAVFRTRLKHRREFDHRRVYCLQRRALGRSGLLQALGWS